MRVGIQDDDQLDDATRAFDDLRAEVAVLRRAVEALGPALKENRSPDYSLSLGQIGHALLRSAQLSGPYPESQTLINIVPASVGLPRRQALYRARPVSCGTRGKSPGKGYAS